MQIYRRQFLWAALAGPALAAKKPEPAPLLDKGSTRVTKIAEGIYVTIADPSKGPQCLSNSGQEIPGEIPGGRSRGQPACFLFLKHPKTVSLDSHLRRQWERSRGQEDVKKSLESHGTHLPGDQKCISRPRELLSGPLTAKIFRSVAARW